MRTDQAGGRLPFREMLMLTVSDSMETVAIWRFRRTTGQIFKFEGSAQSIGSLRDISISVDPHEDDKLWKAIENKAAEQSHAPDGQGHGA